MDVLLSSLQNLDQDQLVVLLFAVIIMVVTMAASIALVLRSFGRWGVVALCLVGAAMAIAVLLR